MDSCLLSKILRYVSVRYVGIFDSKSELAARNFDFDFIALLFELGHYIGSAKGRPALAQPGPGLGRRVLRGGWG